MQQKLCCRGSGSFFLERNSLACCADSDLPFPCPRCGNQERFRCLASLRSHLEYHHSYLLPELSSGSFSITGKLPDQLMAAIPWQDSSLPPWRGQQSRERLPHVRSLSDSRDDGDSYSSARRRTQSVAVGTQEEGGAEDEDVLQEEEGDGSKEDARVSVKMSDPGHLPFRPPAPVGLTPGQDQLSSQDPDQVLDLVDQRSYSGMETAAASAAVQLRLASILRAADNTMQRRLARVSTDLAQTDTELLCERAHSQHLAQKRQEVADRERSLSRQVDVAVMVIAALREQLNASESELERREREVITIQKFLEAASRQETSGKVRIQNFIENLLRRIALAERLLEYYQANRSPSQYSKSKVGSRPAVLIWFP
ncbi:F-box only protein 41 isoform X2 [Melanotaenia boesemani]|uniref:F-box only protein 41 isoform X2 n=1 Tax=Melanotaenia boesemani TaxID=1250792 RepID=UPI001C04B4E7|nr:F-box only protein 41 isoform X2 [Melanotaenia boesemani]